jgi:riboflavin synthase
MFTGIIEQVGHLVRRDDRGDGGRLTVEGAAWSDPLALGESIAVEGVCLTVSAVTPGGFACDILKETLARTTLGRKKPGAPLNLERALRPDSRLGGHFVTGHVDGVGELDATGRAGPDYVLTVRAPEALIGGMVMKGSVALNGVSLTLARLSATEFDVHLIPHTWKQTSLASLRPGDPVNLETDMLGKYVKRFLERTAAGGMTLERLGEAGFL